MPFQVAEVEGAREAKYVPVRVSETVTNLGGGRTARQVHRAMMDRKAADKRMSAWFHHRLVEVAGTVGFGRSFAQNAEKQKYRRETFGMVAETDATRGTSMDPMLVLRTVAARWEATRTPGRTAGGRAGVGRCIVPKCNLARKTVEHILGGCGKKEAMKEKILRHDDVADILTRGFEGAGWMELTRDVAIPGNTDLTRPDRVLGRGPDYLVLEVKVPYDGNIALVYAEAERFWMPRDTPTEHGAGQSRVAQGRKDETGKYWPCRALLEGKAKANGGRVIYLSFVVGALGTFLQETGMERMVGEVGLTERPGRN